MSDFKLTNLWGKEPIENLCRKNLKSDRRSFLSACQSGVYATNEGFGHSVSLKRQKLLLFFTDPLNLNKDDLASSSDEGKKLSVWLWFQTGNIPKVILSLCLEITLQENHFPLPNGWTLTILAKARRNAVKLTSEQTHGKRGERPRRISALSSSLPWVLHVLARVCVRVC